MELDLKDYLKVIRKRLWLVAVIVLVACVTTGVWSYYFIKPVYQASTKLIVNKTTEKVGSSELNLNDVNLNIRIIDTYKEVIRTPYIMETVAKEFPDFQMTAEQLIQKVKVSSVNNTQVMTLSVQDYSYAKAAQIANAVSVVFQREIPKVMQVDNVSILSQAKETDHPGPIKPNPKLNIAISLVVSLMAAVGLIFLLEYLDDSIKTENDVTQFLDLPTLSMIGKINEEELAHSTSATRRHSLGETTHVNATIR
jgi:capsular polysaccharide biosynthesis protein